jgi:hypothetical protein
MLLVRNADTLHTHANDEYLLLHPQNEITIRRVLQESGVFPYGSSQVSTFNQQLITADSAYLSNFAFSGLCDLAEIAPKVPIATLGNDGSVVSPGLARRVRGSLFRPRPSLACLRHRWPKLAWVWGIPMTTLLPTPLPDLPDLAAPAGAHAPPPDELSDNPQQPSTAAAAGGGRKRARSEEARTQ